MTSQMACEADHVLPWSPSYAELSGSVTVTAQHSVVAACTMYPWQPAETGKYTTKDSNGEKTVYSTNVHTPTPNSPYPGTVVANEIGNNHFGQCP